MRRPTAAGPLRPGELAEAVVLADVSLALIVVGQVVPLGGALLIAAVVPFAVVGARHRLRAVIAGAVAGSTVGFLVVGTAALTAMAGCASFGALVGAADRRKWSVQRTIGAGLLLLWPPIALILDFLLWLFADLRKLTLDQVRNGWTGLMHLLANLGLTGIADAGKRALTWILDYWWVTIPIGVFLGVVLGVWLAYGLAQPALQRVRRAFAAEGTDVAADDDTRAARPLPLEVRDVSYRYAGATTDALHDINLDVRPGEFVVVEGPNGSGKSTLARLLAGRRVPTSGVITRPGAIGLGVPGGTAFVFQRPEAQVLGVRVRDDVVWGVPDPTMVDVEAALARVGLAPLIDRETSTLSGGELQRLAVAAALARAPRFFVSDESTAMVDASGRAQLLELFRELSDKGVGVVHVSHYAQEAARADRRIALAQGGMVAPPPLDGEPNETAAPATRFTRDDAPVVELRGVGHVYARKTPWANRALSDVDLTLHRGESVLVVGHNGSGKSTLAWIVAGLVVPTEGDALLDGEPVALHVGRIGLSFQHARLQLLRPTVRDEVKTAANVDDRTAVAALRAVGLDERLASRRVDELSGGQMRRVVLASVLASRPRAIVLDEPFAGLDASGRADLEAVLERLRDEHGIALLMVSHDRDLPPALVDRVVELEGGRIVRDARPGGVVDEASA